MNNGASGNRRGMVSFGQRFKRFCKKPYFYYNLLSAIALGLVYFGVNATSGTALMIDRANNQQPSLIFVSDDKTILSAQNQMIIEPPDLKVVNGESLAAYAPPRVMTQRVFGSIFGQGAQLRNEIIEYAVQSNDTFKSIADNFGISVNTILWANELSSSSTIKVGQTLIILPVSGVVHVVKSGDTLSVIAKNYLTNQDEIASINELADESDIYVGDILVVPNGVMPRKIEKPIQTRLANNYFIYPVAGKITQRLHWYNAVDIAGPCGNSVVAAASGTVVKTKFGWNFGGGNYITIAHDGGKVVSWYGHLMQILVKPGDIVSAGDRIGLVGGRPGMEGAGNSTGCHVHFDVIGAVNPFRDLPLFSTLKY